jgi:sugar/nucleoside kinase (ribokinase family)
LNKIEANRIVEHSDREILDLLRELKKLGARIVVITDGKNGSYLMDEKDHSYYLNSFPSDTVDPTGAGDAFSSGFLFGQVSGKSLNDSMCLGATNAAYVSQTLGAQDGLIKISELEEKAQKFVQYALENYDG